MRAKFWLFGITASMLGFHAAAEDVGYITPHSVPTAWEMRPTFEKPDATQFEFSRERFGQIVSMLKAPSYAELPSAVGVVVHNDPTPLVRIAADGSLGVAWRGQALRGVYVNLLPRAVELSIQGPAGRFTLLPGEVVNIAAVAPLEIPAQQARSMRDGWSAEAVAKEEISRVQIGCAAGYFACSNCELAVAVGRCVSSVQAEVACTSGGAGANAAGISCQK